MNHAVVIDASVVVKVLTAEEFSEQADALITDSIAADRTLVGTPHLVSEVTNALHKKVRLRSITPDEAAQALRQFYELPFFLTSSRELYLRALVFAMENRQRQVYDSIYALLAQELDAEFWTDDRRFIEAVVSVAPWVRWIADYPLPDTDENTERS
jgi:predicted nucleic acid-binding protein